MKYNARACSFNMDTGCVELLLRDGRKISIDCTGVEDALDVTMAQQTELDYLIYNDPLGYADLILNGNPEEYLKNVAGSHGLFEECGGKSRIRRLSIKGYAAINRIPFYTLSLPDRCGIGT